MSKTRIVQCFALCIWGIPAMAQYMWQEGNDSEKTDLGKGIEYGVEMQGSFSNGKTPLWLNANKHGLSSLEKNNEVWFVHSLLILLVAGLLAMEWMWLFR